MTAFDPFLAALTTLTQRFTEIEAHALWYADGTWSDAVGEVLDAEEIAFYAEGLLTEGFSAIWQHLTSATGDAHIRLLFWQAGTPDLPDLPAGWTLADQGTHRA